MKIVNIHAAKTHLSALIEDALSGEVVVISKAGKPMVRLEPVIPKDVRKTLGAWKGKVRINDDFDAPLPPEILRGFGVE